MLVRGILVFAIFGSFVLAAPPHHKTAAINDNQEVRSKQNQPPVPSRNFSVARNSNLSTFSSAPIWCEAGHLERPWARVDIYDAGTSYDVRSAVGCINQLRVFANSASCNMRSYTTYFGGCMCTYRFGTRVDSKGNSGGHGNWFDLIMNEIEKKDIFLGAIVVEVAVGHNDKMLGTAVDCSGKEQGIGGLVERWNQGLWATNEARGYPLEFVVGYNY